MIPHRNATAARFLALPACAALLAMLLAWGAGCANPGGASNTRDAAIQSYVQGMLAYQKGDNDKAMADFKQAVSKNGDLVMARSMLGDLYRSKSEYDSAREQYEVLIRVDPYYYFHHFRLGVSYQRLDRYRDAMNSYLRALNLKPDDPGSNMYLGTVYLELGDKAQAARYAHRATELDPQSAVAWTNLGITLHDMGEYARAETAYRKSLDLNSDQTPIRLFLAQTLLQQKKFGEARSVLAELIKVEDSALHRTHYGDAFLGETNFPEAINQYQAALKIDPDYYPAWNGIAQTNIADYNKGLSLDDTKRKAALDAWQQSLSLKRNQPRVAEQVQKYSKAPMFQP